MLFNRRKRRNKENPLSELELYPGEYHALYCKFLDDHEKELIATASRESTRNFLSQSSPRITRKKLEANLKGLPINLIRQSLIELRAGYDFVRVAYQERDVNWLLGDKILYVDS